MSHALSTADVTCMLVDASESYGSGEAYMLDLMKRARGRRLLALNKVDRVKDKTELLPRLSAAAQGHAFAAIVPMSARRGSGSGRQRGQDVRVRAGRGPGVALPAFGERGGRPAAALAVRAG